MATSSTSKKPATTAETNAEVPEVEAKAATKAKAPAAKAATTKAAAAKTATTKAAATKATSAKTAAEKPLTKAALAKLAKAEAAALAEAEGADAVKPAAKKAVAAKKPAAKRATKKTAEVEEIDEAAVAEAERELAEAERAKTKSTVSDEPLPTGAIVLRASDDEESPQISTMIPGATADPVKDYLKQIGKVALLNAAEEVELAMRIEAGLFAAEKLATEKDLPERLERELRWV